MGTLSSGAAAGLDMPASETERGNTCWEPPCRHAGLELISGHALLAVAARASERDASRSMAREGGDAVASSLDALGEIPKSDRKARNLMPAPEIDFAKSCG